MFSNSFFGHVLRTWRDHDFPVLSRFSHRAICSSLFSLLTLWMFNDIFSGNRGQRQTSRYSRDFSQSFIVKFISVAFSSAKEISKRFHILDTSENIVQRWRIKLSRLRFVCFRFVLRNRIVDLFRRTFLSKRSLFLFEKIYEEPLSHAKPITFFALSSRWSTKVGKAEKWTLSLE